MTNPSRDPLSSTLVSVDDKTHQGQTTRQPLPLVFVGWVVVQRRVNTERSICANCGGGKPAQSAKDGQRDAMHITLSTR